MLQTTHVLKRIFSFNSQPFYFCCLFFSLVTGAFFLAAKEEAPSLKRTLSFSTGYLTDSKNLNMGNSNQAMAGFFEEVNEGLGYGFDALAQTGWAQRNAGWFLFLSNALAAVWSNGAIGTAYHEFGHFTRFKALGYQAPYFEVGTEGKGTKYKNVFSYFTALLLKPGEGGATASGDKWKVNPSFNSPDDLNNAQQGHNSRAPFSFGMARIINPLVVFAGVNNAMYLSERIAERTYNEGSHLIEGWAYLDGRLQSLVYSLDDKNKKNPGKGDMDLMIDHYKLAGISVNKARINQANLIAFFGSATTWAYVSGWFDYSVGGSGRVDALEYKGFRLPDISAYFLTQGISYRVASGYRISDTLHIPVSVEFVPQSSKGVSDAILQSSNIYIQGLVQSMGLEGARKFLRELYQLSRGCEASVGISKRFEGLNNFSLTGNVLFGRSFGYGLKAHMPYKRFFVEGSFEAMNMRSYYGQRHIPQIIDHIDKKLDADQMPRWKDIKDYTFAVRVGVTY